MAGLPPISLATHWCSHRVEDDAVRRGQPLTTRAFAQTVRTASCQTNYGVGPWGLRAHIHLVTAEAFPIANAGAEGDFPACLDEPSVDLDKAWHAIHFLITGDTTRNFFLSGAQIAQVSEHCEVHPPRSVAALHAHLGKTSASEIMSTFDPEKLNALGIYDEAWDQTSRRYIEERLVRFMAIVQRATAKGLGKLVVIS
jgi:Domain of unknown function (DUF1877)